MTAHPPASHSSLVAAWRSRWSDGGGAIALRAPAEGVAWSGDELSARIAAAARALAARGVGPGDRVLLSAAPGSGTVVSYAAILAAGATVVPVNTAATAAEIAHYVALAGPVAGVVDDPERLPGGVAAIPPADLAVPRGDGGADAMALPGPNDTAMLAFTSGTTGRPKAAPLTHAQLLAGAAAVVEAWAWTADDVLVHALPMFHMHGLGVGLNGGLLAGSAITVLPRFDPGAVVTEPGTMFFGVPAMYARIASVGRLADLSGRRLLVSGSAPLSVEMFAEIARATGQAPLERYGMTETVMIAGNPLDGERHAGTVGQAMPGMRIRIGDDQVVEVTGPSVFSGYLSHGATGFTDDGWFRTGDIGIWDDGYLRLVGRESDLIITNGFNVYPREVEEALLQVVGVDDVAVVGRPDRDRGECVVAHVVGEATVDAMQKHLVDVLAPYKHPREWVFHEALPRNAMGKVLRSELAASN